MKKFIVLGAICAVFGASVAFAATKIQEIKAWDFIAQVQTVNKGNVMLYKVVDGTNTCYIISSDDTKWGSSPQISCVK